jgi:hypothetical protein
MDAISTDQTVKAGSDRGHGVNGFDQDPHLYHVSGFPVVAGGLKPGGDYDPGVIFMEEKSVTHATSNIGVIVRSKTEGTGLPVSV